MSKKSSKSVATITTGYIRNDDTRVTALAVNQNAKCLKDALNRIEELEKQIEILKKEKNNE